MVKRSKKTSGEVNVRLRLRDRNNVDIFHKTEIKISSNDLSRLTLEGNRKKGVTNISDEVIKSITNEKRLMSDAYALMKSKGMDLNSDVLEMIILEMRNPVEAVRKEAPSIVDRFRKITKEKCEQGLIADTRCSHILVVADKLDRFLKINGLSRITSQEFTAEHLMKFRQFLFEEYTYVKKWEKLYEGVSKRNLPSKRLSQNTVTSQLKMFKTFFSELESSDEIAKSPFRQMSRSKQESIMRTMYDEPFFLRKEEFEKVRTAKIPNYLLDIREAFVVQCAIGCRISEFQRLSMDNIRRTDEGIPYVSYLPIKDQRRKRNNEEVKIPLVRFAFDIIKRNDFHFPILNNIYGEQGYNPLIKSLMKACGMDRKVALFNEDTKQNEQKPLHEVASSKLCRRTHVDMVCKIQLDSWAAGLHAVGSNAVSRYSSMEIRDSFKLLNLAFGQESYTVDDSFNVIGE